MADDTQLSKLITLHNIKGIKKCLSLSENLDMNFRDIMYDLQTPLMRMCHVNLQEAQLLDMFEVMLNKSCDINIKDGSGRTLLSHACYVENNSLIEKLASCKHFYCNPNVEDDDGGTPLFYAIRTRNPTVVATLLDCFLGNGLDINHKDHTGTTALEVAESKCDREICHLLKSIGKACVSNSNLPSPNVTALKQRRSPTPKSSRNMKKRQSKKKQDLSPLIVPNKNTSSTQNIAKSCESLKSNEYYDDVFESNEYKKILHKSKSHKQHKNPGLTPRERENSFALPDLRANSGSLVSSTPSSTSFMSDFSFKNISTAATEEENQDSDDEPEEYAKSFDSSSFGRKKRKNSLSLPELRLDTQRDQNSGYSTKSNKKKSPTTTPRINVLPSARQSKLHYSIDASASSFLSNSNGSLSSRNKSKKESGSGLTLPQIDTTPRAGFPTIETDRSTKGNSTNRGLKGLRNYDALVS